MRFLIVVSRAGQYQDGGNCDGWNESPGVLRVMCAQGSWTGLFRDGAHSHCGNETIIAALSASELSRGGVDSARGDQSQTYSFTEWARLGTRRFDEGQSATAE